MTASEWFEHYFFVLTKNKKSFDWQRSLYFNLVAAKYPRVIDLPTGTGKTSLMAVWLLALGYLAKSGGILIPRRLVWVVNRRVVVDQATDTANELVAALEALQHDDELRSAISGLSASGSLLAVSTLRGERADNGEWKQDPSRAAIITGTVDKIGSGILFSGYGDGEYYRPVHAGLLTVDALLINDESHLSPAFAKLARAIEKMQPAASIGGKEFRFVEMSATHSETDSGPVFPESLLVDVEASEVFAQRYLAPKRLFLDLQPDNKRAETRMVELAAGPGAARTLVFVEQPEKARDLSVRLSKEDSRRVELLTGTMRGKERDNLAESEVFNAFRAAELPGEQMWMVMTAAGEVGVDITSERMVTDLASADHMIQRFGRLNRHGLGIGEVHVVYTEAVLKDPAKKATLEYLQSLGDQFCSRDLRERPAPREAQSESVVTAELHAWLIELWSQTSDPVRSYPKVEPWLHGQQDNVAETELAWRKDVSDLAKDTVREEDRTAALKKFPVLARERLREPTNRMKEKLGAMALASPATKVLVRERDGDVVMESLKSVADRRMDELAYALIVLPLGCGGLQKGMLVETGGDPPDDVADGLGSNGKKRWRVRSQNGEPVAWDGEDGIEAPSGRTRLEVVISQAESETPESIRYCEEFGRKPNSYEYTVVDHLEDVKNEAERLATLLVPELLTDFSLAAKGHDLGKKRPLWQRWMGACPGVEVAKSVGVPSPLRMGGYRHELGSLLDMEASDDLTAHLVAAHHGRARPHFEEQAVDVNHVLESWVEMKACPERFGRLSEQYGPWGLAYLETILKAADATASRNKDTEEQENG